MSSIFSAIDGMFGRRTLAMCAAAYAAGIWWGVSSALPSGAFVLMAAGVGFTLIFLRRMHPAMILALALSIGAAASGLAVMPKPMPGDDYAYISGRCVSTNGILTLKDVRVDGISYPGYVRVYADDAPDIFWGDIVSGFGYVRVPEFGVRNVGGRDVRLSFLSRGVTMIAYMDATRLDIAAYIGINPLNAISRAAKDVAARIDVLFGDRAPVAQALLLGDSQDMQDEQWDAFVASGIVHLLVVSGFHVMALAGAISWVLRLIMPHNYAQLCSIPMLMLYAPLTGCRPPVVRAALTSSHRAVGQWLHVPTDALTSLCLAGLIMLIARPLALFDVSFQLSFCAAIALTLLSTAFQPDRPKLIRAGNPPMRFIGRTIRATVAAQCGTLLIALSINFPMPIFGIIGNVLAMPLAMICLPCALFAVVTSYVWMPFSRLIAAGCDVLISGMTAIADVISRLPNALMYPPRAWGFCAVVPIMMMYFASRYGPLRRKWRAAVVCALPMAMVVILVLPGLVRYPGLEAHFLSVGQGDCTVMLTKTAAVVVDTGPQSREIVDFLSATGRRPDAIIISHPHSDHMTGLRELLVRYAGVKVYLPANWERDIDPNYYLEVFGGVLEPITLRAGDVLTIGDITIDVLSAHEDKRDNAASLVLLAESDGHSILFTGDCPASDMPEDVQRVTALKVAHHGALDALMPELPKQIMPDVAIISVGRNNFGHPAAQTLHMLDALGISTYRTDLNGGVRVRFSDDGISIHTMLR